MHPFVWFSSFFFFLMLFVIRNLRVCQLEKTKQDAIGFLSSPSTAAQLVSFKQIPGIQFTSSSYMAKRKTLHTPSDVKNGGKSRSQGEKLAFCFSCCSFSVVMMDQVFFVSVCKVLTVNDRAINSKGLIRSTCKQKHLYAVNPSTAHACFQRRGLQGESS